MVFEVPRNWFEHNNGKPEQWEGCISIAATTQFKHLALLNTRRRLYLAYKMIAQKDTNNHGFETHNNIGSYECIAKQIIPDQSQADSHHGRNQEAKEFPILTVRVHGEGTTAFCYFEQEQKKSIKFQNDDPHAKQDVIFQQVDECSHFKDLDTIDKYQL